MAWILFVISQLLLVVELYLPSGIMAFLGFAVYLSSLYQGFLEFHGALYPLFLLFTFCISVAVVYAVILHIKSSGSKNTLLLSSTQEGYQASQYDEKLIGTIGVSITDLGPSGFIAVEGFRIQALSEAGYVEKGSRVVIERGQGSYLIVRKIE
ncbi:MAG: NfeD family protein [Chlamydia sp.]